MLCSCSVKEDRDGCPCVLTIDLRGCTEWKDELSLKGWNATKTLFGISARAGDYPGGLEVQVPKGSISYFAHSPLPDSRKEGKNVYVREGHQADSLYAYRTTLSVSGDRAYDKVTMHKQFATLNVTFGSGAEAVQWVDSISVMAEFNGIDLETFRPVKGRYVSGTGLVNSQLSVRIPRQGDGELTLELFREGKSLETVDLAEILRKKDYSWDDEDLEDIWIDFNGESISIAIGLSSWEEGEIYFQGI